jgi:hypothetical protein
MTTFARWQELASTLPGWFQTEAAAACDILLEWQETKFETVGHLLEIGLFRAKSASLFAAHARPGEDIYLIENLHHPPTEELLRQLAPERNFHFIYERSSHVRGLPALAGAERRCRWIHIDGEHTGEAMWNDLELAHGWLDDRGIVCVDDFFQPMYPQVTAAVFAFLAQYRHALSLFMVGFSKGFLCRPMAARNFYEPIRSGLIEAMDARGVSATLTKTTHPTDMSCFGLTHRNLEEGSHIGLDWDKGNLPL